MICVSNTSLLEALECISIENIALYSWYS